MTLSYANSAANPVIYTVFSHNFRYLFRRLLCAACLRGQPETAADVITVISRRENPRNTRTSTMKSQNYMMKQHGASPAMDDIADDQIIVKSDDH